MPSIVKLEHHHDHTKLKAGYEIQFNSLHEKCAICNFEFSFFLTGIKKIELLKENPLVNYCNKYHSVYFSNLPHFSSLLRAPPCLTKLI